MSLRRRTSALVLALAFVAACDGKKATPETTVPATASATPSLASPSAPPSPPVATTVDGDAAVAVTDAKPTWAFDCTDTSTPKGGKSIGHTSVVFKLLLSSGKKAAWKPNAKKVKGRYKGEVAAFRLAEALGIANVPPACIRVFDARAAAAVLAQSDEASTLFADEVIVEQGKVYGALIPWIDGLSFWPIEKEPLRTEARAWLGAGKPIPAGKSDLARQASMLVAFDFITGNWDRYSGENVGLDPTGTHVLFIDNDAAFMEGPPKAQLERNKALLDGTDRFSRAFVAGARKLDAERLAAVFGDEAPGRPLLSSAVTENVARRIKELVAIVDAKIAARGEAETLYFR